MKSEFNVKIVDDAHIQIGGRIDSSNALDFEDSLKQFIVQDFDFLTIDSEKLTYISSAGLRVLMKLRSKARNTITIENTPEPVNQIFEMTGFTQLFKVRKGFRHVSVEGCPVIGVGFFGTVYRLDPDTIVKVYHPSVNISQIENEQKMAKAAFLKGIPTAISYDIVKVGDSYGSVFELLKAVSFNDLVIQHPDQIDDIVRKWCDILKIVHSTYMEPGVMPSAKKSYFQYLDAIRTYLDEPQYQFLYQYLEKIPERLSVIHGDFQMKNVMLSDNDPMLIDMETLATGHPVFDFAGIYVAYIEFEEDEPGNMQRFLGISADTASYIFEKLMEYYLETTNPTLLASEILKIRIVSAIRFLYIITMSDLNSNELSQKRILTTKEHINEFMKQSETLNF